MIYPNAGTAELGEWGLELDDMTNVWGKKGTWGVI